MAYSYEQWERAKAYYTAGLSLREIEAKTGINNSSIQKKAKSQQWKHGVNSDYIEAKVIIAEKKSAENSAVISTLDEIADEAIRNKDIIHRLTKKALAKAEVLLNEVDNMSDIRTAIELADKASLTLGVNQRHAPKVEVTNTNAQQNNTEIKRVTIVKRGN